MYFNFNLENKAFLMRPISFLLKRPSRLGLFLSLSIPLSSYGQGGLSQDIWFGVSGRSIPECRESPVYYQEPSTSSLVANVDFTSAGNNNYLRRLRGTVTAPVSGDYFFWIASDERSELWLSSDSTKFSKNLVAFVAGRNQRHQFDRFFRQRTAKISLEAGEQYYIEIFHKDAFGDDHLSLAWTVPGQERAIIPPGHFQPYSPSELDQDDDDLLDAWELENGLDPEDNGSEDIEMGPCGDPDRDGLINLDEFLNQTNPTQHGGSPGKMRMERWVNVAPGDLDDFVQSEHFLEVPAQVGEESGIEGPRGSGNDYVTRRRGLLVVPSSGQYTFSVAGDEFIQLWLSSTASKFDRELVVDLTIQTGFRSWEESPAQLSEPVFLEEGQSYYIEILHKELSGNDYSSVAWSKEGEPYTLIPPSALTSFSRDLDDFDDDGLPDSWEMAYGLNPTDNGIIDPQNGAFGDADGDGLDNISECLANSDPGTLGNEPGQLTREVWRSIRGFAVADLTSHPFFTRAPNVSETIEGFNVPSNWGGSYGQRIRGTISPQVSGHYTFQVASDNGSELWLSTDHRRFNRRLAASVGRVTLPEQYDRSLAQTSVPIYLEAGRRYYLEVLHKEHVQNDHLSMRWKREEGDYTAIPSSAFFSHFPDPNDQDDDGLPDDWEIAFGLDPDSNGHDDPREGSYGDFDGDGINNWDELLRGFNPALAGLNPGLLSRDIWRDLPDRDVETLTSQPTFPSEPATTSFVDSFEPLAENNAGARYHGILQVPETGEYTFWIVGDDRAELWLGTDETPYSRRRIAHGFMPNKDNEFDEFSEQQSAPVLLENGQSYHFEVLYRNLIFNRNLAVAWSRDGGERTLLPFSALLSPALQANDSNQNLLQDSWEQTYGFPDLQEAPTLELAQEFGPYADPDQDYIPNYLESFLGTNPFLPESVDGALTYEQWFETGYFSLLDAQEQEDGIYVAPHSFSLLEASTTGRVDRGRHYHRLRGYLVAPKTGSYRFWISGSMAVDLWLSKSSDKYSKERIAGLSPEEGHVGGVRWGSADLRWDTFVNQFTKLIHLEEGEAYFVEMLSVNEGGGNSHISLAWAPPGESRAPVPVSALRSYHQVPEDQDDDYLPDSWELQYGLSTTDNGLIARTAEGERGDYDGDGLSNRAEYLLGTDPTLVDSDGDGLSDLEESQYLGTDPNTSDASPETVVDVISLEDGANFGSDWITAGDGSLLATSFRGAGSWDFEVPTEGHWVVQMEAQLRGDLRFDETLPVIVSIDGVRVGRYEMRFLRESPGSLRFLTPWLQGGSHTFEIFIDNLTTRRSLAISQIQILTPSGTASSDSNLPDWASAELQQRSNLHGENVRYSFISPALIEGESPSLPLADVTTIRRSSSSDRAKRFPPHTMDRLVDSFQRRLANYATRLQRQMRAGRGRMEGTQSPVLQGPGTTRWLSQLTLRPNEVIGYVAQLEALGFYQTGSIAWVPANVFELDQLTIPVGSELLLGAWLQDWDRSDITLTIEGQTAVFPSTESYRHQFNTPGTFQVIAQHEDGHSSSLTVQVRSANLPDHLSVGEQRFFRVELPGVGPDLSFDSNRELTHASLSAFQQGSRIRYGGDVPGIYYAAARLNQGHLGGQQHILAQTPVYVVGVSDAVRNQGDIVSPYSEDIFLTRSPLLITHLPPGGTVVANIFAAGVTFPDGSTDRTLTSEDFDENGIFTFEFLIPRERLGAPCHFINVYNAQGEQIWTEVN